MAQQRKDPVETYEEDPEEEDIVGMQEDIPGMQGGDLIEGKGSGEDLNVDKDWSLGVEFAFDELFEKLGKR